MADKPLTRNELEAQIIAKAWKDPEFRKKLLDDPKGTLQAEVQALHPGVVFPEGFKVNVVEEQQNEITLVVPVNPAGLVDKEISDEELDSVAGGTACVVSTVTDPGGFPPAVLGPVIVVVMGPINIHIVA